MAKKLKGMTDQDLKAMVAHEISMAESSRALTMKKVTRSLEYYEGDMKDIVSEAGRSSAMSKDLADTMGWMLPGIIRVFTASEHMAIVEPAGKDDQEWAENATQGVNYTFWKENSGYRIIYSATWDSLLAGNGIVKVWYDDTPKTTVSFHTGLDDMELAQLLDDPNVTVLQHDERQESLDPTDIHQDNRPLMPEQPDQTQQQPPPDQSPAGPGGPEAPPTDGMTPVTPGAPNSGGLAGPPQAPPDQAMSPIVSGPVGPITYTVHDVKIERRKDYGCIKLECIAPEDYGKDDDSETCEEARFQYHRATKTRSDLIEMGFDRNEVEKINVASEWDSPQAVARNKYMHEHDGDPSTEAVDFYECYLKVDINDDGIAEMVKVSYAGDKTGGLVLDWEEWEDEVPFQDIPCNPMPHRFDASSISDETIDVQAIKTVLYRNGLDNIYANSNPQRFVTGTIKNPEALFSPTFGETLFGEPGATVTPLPIPFVADKVFDGIQLMDQIIERRTGVSKTTMALDPEALSNQTATAVQAGRDAAYSQIELIARNQAELGWKAVFKKILLLEIKHRNKPRDIRMQGKPVTVDPRYWDADMDVSINVGLGTGSRDRDMQILNQVKQDLMLLGQAAAANGYQEVAVQILPYLLTTMHKFGESSGLHNPELFYPEITDQDVLAMQAMIQQQKSQPDPKTMIEQQKLQLEGQKTQAQMQLEQQKGQMQMQLEQMKNQAAIDKETAQRNADAQIAQMQNQFKIQEMQLKADLEREKMAQEKELKMLELGLKMDETTGVTATVKSQVDTMVMQAIKDLGVAVGNLQAGATLPKRIVRDPLTGKAMGLETMGSEAPKVIAAKQAKARAGPTGPAVPPTTAPPTNGGGMVQ
jgi:hypothetical protein